MSKRQLIIIAAVWSMIFLFLGFPFWLDKIIAVVTGCIIIGLSYSLRISTTPRSKPTLSPEVRESAAFVEHKHDPQVSPTDN